MLAYIDRLPKWASPPQYRRSNKVIIAAIGAFFVFLWISIFHESIPHFPSSQSFKNPISNSTLGFEKIYSLGLPGREDRIKPLLDAAEATNLTLTVLNAVRDQEIDEADFPNWKPDDHRPGELGCLASHVRTWNLIIASNVSSALILESDADWDLRIRDSMQPLATGIRTLVDWPFTVDHQHIDLQTSPYGDTWDILWIGHCGSNHDGNIRAYAWNDTSAPPKNREFWFGSGLMDEQYIPGTRTVFQFDGTLCSTGYAVSYQGAVKLAEYFKDADDNLDLQLSSVCSKKTDMTCLGVWPQIITAASTKSNIEHSDEGDDEQPDKEEDFEVIGGPAIQYSARVNAKKILNSGVGYVPQLEWTAEWDTCWGINPYKNHSWQMMKLNETTGEPIYLDDEDTKKKQVGTVLTELEVETLNNRARRALLMDPY